MGFGEDDEIGFTVKGGTNLGFLHIGTNLGCVCEGLVWVFFKFHLTGTKLGYMIC